MAFLSAPSAFPPRFRPRTNPAIASRRPVLSMSATSAELRRRLASVNSAEKLIDAMRLVAAARIRASSQSALQTRPFAEKLQEMLASLIASMARDGHDALHAAGGSVRHDAYAVLSGDLVTIDPKAQKALMDRLYLTVANNPQHVTTICLVVVAADKGFCGTYNREVIARAVSRSRYLRERGMVVEIVCVGKVAAAFFERRKEFFVRTSIEHSGRTATSDAASELCDVLLTSFIAGDVDRIEIVYTRFVSILSNAPSVRTLVPLTPSGIESLGDEIFELTSSEGHFSTRPSERGHSERWRRGRGVNPQLQLEPEEAALLLNAMLPMYVNSQLVRIMRESMASEHASRMSAMSVATDNARNVAEALKIRYNQERQARITKEIIEVMAHSSSH